jgi:glycopeptide antibiotics resistance protein
MRLYYGYMAVAITALLVYGSFVPFNFVPMSLLEAWREFQNIIVAGTGSRGTRVDWSINFLVTFPLGFVGMGIGLADRPTFPRVLWVLPLVIVWTTMLSFGVEFGQVWFEGRVPSLADLKAQAMGVLSGVGLWGLIGQRFTRWLHSFAASRGRRERTEWLLQAYVMGLVAYSLLPLDVITSPGELAQKYRSGKFEWIPFQYVYASSWEAFYGYMTQVVLFVPVGIWSTLATTSRGRTLRHWTDQLMLGALVVLGIEVLQAIMLSRYTSTTDVLLGTSGVALGSAGASIWRRRGGVANAEGAGASRVTSWFLAALAYGILLGLVFWAPFQLSSDRQVLQERWREFWSVPFSRMHTGSDLHAMFSVLRMVVWFFPLGFILGTGFAKLSSRTVWKGVAIGIAILAVSGVAFAIEFGQVLIPERFADWTDAAICSFGGSMGVLVAVKCYQRSSPGPVVDDLNGSSCIS